MSGAELKTAAHEAGDEKNLTRLQLQQNVVDQLVNTAAQHIRYSPDKLRQAIAFGFQQNMLAYNQTDRQCRLSWVEPAA